MQKKSSSQYLKEASEALEKAFQSLLMENETKAKLHKAIQRLKILSSEVSEVEKEIKELLNELKEIK